MVHLRKPNFKLRIDKVTTTVTLSVPGSNQHDEVEVEPDMLPIPPLKDGGNRTWGIPSLLGFWIAEAFGISQYQVASSSIAAGLSPGATIGAVLLGHFLVGVANAASGYVGCVYGINYPVFARSSFGQRGVYLALVCRSVAAIIWAGTQTYQGGQCVQVMLQAIWPSFINFPNHLPASANVTSSQLLCFFIFYIIQLPLLWIPMPKLRYLFMIKIVVMPIFGLSLFGWAVGRAHGFGPMWTQPTRTSNGNPAAVIFFSAMSAAIAPKATLALNIADFTRYAKSSRVVVWTNVISLTFLVTLCAMLGVVVTSCVEVIYGKATWNPLQVAALMGRAPKFFVGLCWGFSVLATNISANTTAVANDLMLAFPRFIDIRRGQYICIIIALATTPWNIQNNAASFTAFLSGYSVFLGPCFGIMITDYYIIRRKQLNLGRLYKLGPGGDLWYTHGVNLRAVVAFAVAIAPVIPGLARGIQGKSTSIPRGVTYIYCVVWPFGVVVSSLVYYLSNILFPRKMLPASEVEEVHATYPTESGLDMDDEKKI